MKIYGTIPDSLIAFIKTGSKFIVAGHKEPDGDCVGSQLALASFLRRMGKEAVPCSAGPFNRTEIKPFAGRFISEPDEKLKQNSKVIVIDCAAPHRTGDLAPHLEGLPLAIMDHHKTGEHPASTAEAPVYFDPEAPSVTFMILRLMEKFGMEPAGEEAELMLFGLCTDTGFFRHVDNTGAETLAAASRMVQAGANPKKIYQAIHGGRSLNSRILMGLTLSRSEAFFGGRLVLTTETYEDTRRFGMEGRDSDNLYALLQSVAGVEAIVVIRQEKPDKCSVGFRSRDAVDVAAIAALFGGGGHKNASGLSIAGTIDEIKPKILEAFTGVFD
jgi:phosphoesterase RecJ-like protein